MPSDSKLIWDVQFEYYQSQGIEVSIFLSNGIRLNGKILKFDETALLLTSPKDPQGMTIQRNLIATLVRFTNEQHQSKENPRGR